LVAVLTAAAAVAALVVVYKPLRDAYRELNPSGSDHSWISPRFGSQRLDHSLIGVGAGEIQTCAYDHTTRSEDLSDHAALLTTIELKPDRETANS
jgi:hypothetical protein